MVVWSGLVQARRGAKQRPFRQLLPACTDWWLVGFLVLRALGRCTRVHRRRDVVQRRWCGVAGHDESREAGRKVLLVRNVVAIVRMWAQGWRRDTGAPRR